MRRLLLLSLLALLAACGPLGQPDAEEIVRRAQVALEGMDRAHAVVEIDATVEGESIRVVGEGWVDGEKRRAEILEASEPALEGAVAVSDGESGWLYHPEMARVLKGDIEALEAYRDSEGDALSEVDFASLTELVDQLLGVTEQELVGTEIVAGQEAWHLRLTPNEESPPAWIAAGGTVELWISKEHNIPLQLLYSGGLPGEGRITVLEFQPDPASNETLFGFTPPAGIEVVDITTLLPEHMTLPEARAEAGFPLLSTPSDSGEAALVEVYRVGDGYVQSFEGSLGEWTLSQHSPSIGIMEKHDRNGGEAETVQVRGVEGTLVSDAERGWTMLAWEEGGVQIALGGRIAPETALSLAALLE